MGRMGETANGRHCGGAVGLSKKMGYRTDRTCVLIAISPSHVSLRWHWFAAPGARFWIVSALSPFRQFALSPRRPP